MFRRVWFAGSVLVFAAAVQPAFSADIIEVPDVAPPVAAPAPLDWTGFYIGGAFGYGWTHIDGEAVTEIPLWPGVGGALPTELYGPSLSAEGWLASGVAGFDWQFTPGWVGGLFVDYTYFNDFSDSATTGDLGGGFHKDLSFELNHMITAAGRLGFLVNPSNYLYGLAGWSWAEANISEFEGCEPFGASCDDLSYGGSVDGHGLTLGAGWETLLTSNISASVEYRWTDLSFDSVSGACTPNNGGNCGRGYFGSASADADVQTIRAALKFRM